MLASTAQPGKQEIRTANTATTWLGADGGGEAVGILVSIMHAGVIPIMFRQDAGLMPLHCRSPIREIVPGTPRLFCFRRA
jgi:hypothetical protein